MSFLGIPPRIVAGVCVALATIGIVAVVAGAFPSRELIFVVALLIVAAINWRRAQGAATPPPGEPER